MKYKYAWSKLYYWICIQMKTVLPFVSGATLIFYVWRWFFRHIFCWSWDPAIRSILQNHPAIHTKNSYWIYILLAKITQTQVKKCLIYCQWHKFWLITGREIDIQNNFLATICNCWQTLCQVELHMTQSYRDTE